MTLSRRDRAAMVLALHALRRWADEPRKPTSYARDRCLEAQACLEHVGERSPLFDVLPEMRFRASDSRVVRARLALLLRVLLRADSNDPPVEPMWRCSLCGEEFYGAAACIYGCPGDVLPFRPLWEQARPSEVAR